MISPRWDRSAVRTSHPVAGRFPEHHCFTPFGFRPGRAFPEGPLRRRPRAMPGGGHSSPTPPRASRWRGEPAAFAGGRARGMTWRARHPRRGSTRPRGWPRPVRPPMPGHASSGWAITASSASWAAAAWASSTRPSASRSRSGWRSRSCTRRSGPTRPTCGGSTPRRGRRRGCTTPTSCRSSTTASRTASATTPCR